MYRNIEKEGLTKIELIGKYKVLTRLYEISNKIDNKNELQNILDMFYKCYPNFKGIELKETYGIPVDNGVTLEIKTYSNQELELPNFPYYEELLYLNILCNKIHKRELFPTMVGQVYYRVGYKNSFYKVIYLEYRYGYEQVFILQNLNTKSDIVTFKLDEWSNSRLSTSHEWCCNYESMLNFTLSKKIKEFESNKKDLENIIDIIKEGHLSNHNISLETEPGTWLKFKDDEYLFGRLDKKPRVKDIINNVVILTIEVDGKEYDANRWEILY